MDSRTTERVERWESRPFSGGTDELASLADAEFSGAVTAAGAWLFMLNGRVVGVIDGQLEDVTDATGTIYDAPEDVLPLLAAMIETGGETRGTYYTNETSIAEVDRKLQQGSFTGYLELSEQVLSGDYYAVYYGGRRMSAAYIGNAERLVTGEEAFERADDEVGIYEVVDVDVTVTDIPGSEPTPATDESAQSADVETTYDEDPATGTGGADAGSTIDDVEAGTAASDPGETGSSVSPGAAAGSDRADERPGGDESAVAGGPAASTGVDTAPAAGTESADDRQADSPEPTEPAGSSITRADESDDDGDASGANGSTSITTSADEAGDEDGQPDERFKEEERWRETRQIPSIDPDTTQSPGTEQSNRTDRQGATNRRREASRRQSTQSSTTGTTDQTTSAGASRQDPEPDDVASTDPTLRSDMLEREDKIDRLTQRVTELEEEKATIERERDEYAAETDKLTETIETLQSRIESLESRLGSGASESTAATSTESGQAGSVSLTPAQALSQTNVFVRYDSKSQTTLETAHGGDGSRSDLANNLQLERHTQFDASSAVVDGQPYDEFIEGTIQYRFVAWLIETALFEIRETGHAGGLADLYDVIPRIDRVELSSSISLEDDDTENVPDQVAFDVAAFDKRGTPLVVANCNDSRDPASRELLESLEADASAVCANYQALGGAVAVTSSFFEPGALELAEEATTGGFLSRNSKLSHISLSRKQGYHLCLVESRSGGFHMTVPEL